MNFIIWLLKRIKRTMLRTTEEWHWVRKYRRMILEEKFLSIMLTTMLGTIFIGSTALGVVIYGGTREVASTAIDLAGTFVVSFYLYNWLAALYDVYTTEKMATWHALKDE